QPLRVGGVHSLPARLEIAAGGAVGAGLALEDIAVATAPVGFVTLTTLAGCGITAGGDTQGVLLITDVGTLGGDLRPGKMLAGEETPRGEKPAQPLAPAPTRNRKTIHGFLLLPAQCKRARNGGQAGWD